MTGKLLVSGCSITHGCELHDVFYHPLNIQQSFSAMVATQLELELENVALPGASNEYIYNSLISRLRKYRPSLVIAAWTFPDRLYWNNQGRHWFFNSGWASTFVDFKCSGAVQKVYNGVSHTADSADKIDTLQQQHKILVNHYFDSEELLQKLCNYSYSLQCVCKQNDITLIEIDAAKNYRLNITRLEDLGLDYIGQQRHPNHQEHAIIANCVLNLYKEKNVKQTHS